LSGGEKGRLALAKLIYSRVNVLVLDEPTNHLDIPSREALEEALDAFEGTIVTISHDRYFLDRVATQILALDGEGVAEHYDGDYTEYHDWKAKGTTSGAPPFSEKQWIGSTSGPADQSLTKVENPAAPEKLKSSAGKGKQSGKGKEATSSAKPGVKVIKKNRTESGRPELLEAEIAKAEKKLSEISERMSEPQVARDATELVKLDGQYKETESELAALYEQWEKVAAQG
jgi:ATP-binding cassette subfamily F protein 3